MNGEIADITSTGKKRRKDRITLGQAIFAVLLVALIDVFFLIEAVTGQPLSYPILVFLLIAEAIGAFAVAVRAVYNALPKSIQKELKKL
jgi:hypothetical protein